MDLGSEGQHGCQLLLDGVYILAKHTRGGELAWGSGIFVKASQHLYGALSFREQDDCS